jgi:RNA polymerase subunit RPABC4/transcription elongation factor Spt4
MGKYCSNSCQQNHKYETVTKPLILEGKVSEHRTLKNYIIKEFGENCKCCGQDSRWNGLILTFDLDHIDGNSDNNFPNNLRLLCPNCHSQQPTTKNRNKKFNKRNLYLQNYKRSKNTDN